jgi:hypothetical protein
MSFLYEFPKKSAFGRALPKNKIYEHASPTTAVKALFVRQVDKIIWSYKLSPETINLPAKSNVQEIQIFTIVLKSEVLKYEVLSAIDKAIPSPIVFILAFKNKHRYVAAYKRQNVADKNKRVVSNYFESKWMSDDKGQVALPVVLDLGTLYHTILKIIMPLSARQSETMDELVARLETLKLKEREAAILETRLNKEKQFNREVEINAEFRNLKKEIKDLKQ